MLRTLLILLTLGLFGATLPGCVYHDRHHGYRHDRWDDHRHHYRHWD